MINDKELRLKIEEKFPTIGTWKIRVASEDHDGDRIEPDDDDWPPFRTSTLARVGLSVATDNLMAIRTTFEAGQLYPFAQMNLARAALIGSSQAVFILSAPDSSGRVARSRQAALESLTQELKYYRWVDRAAPGLKGPDFDNIMEHVGQRIKELEAKRSASGERATWIYTDVIANAAAQFKSDPDLEPEIMHIWSTTSAAVHGLPWHMIARAGAAAVQAGEPKGNRIADMTMGGGLDLIAEPFLAAYWMTAKGWMLFDSLRAGGR